MARQTWTIRGRLEVDHLLPELEAILGSSSPLDGITVKVSARSRVLTTWGTWNSWGTVTTGANGSFSVSKERGSDRRQFKVRILFDSDRLRIKEGQETSISLGNDGFPLDIEFDLTDKDWHEVHNDKDGAAPDGRRAGLHDLGTIKARPRLVREHADLWLLYGMVFDSLADMGPNFAMDRKLVVKYPMGIANNSAASNSYSNPLNGRLYIKEGEFESRTLLHELMHQWAYDRTRGEDGMAWQLVKHGDTHAPREATTFVPFHEAFADWSAYQLLERISDGDLTTFLEGNSQTHPERPHTRAHLGAPLGASERFLANVDFTERGWRSLFTLLVHPRMHGFDFNQPMDDTTPQYALARRVVAGSCSELTPGLTFRKVLAILNTHEDIPGADRKLGNDDLDFDDFLARARRIHDQVTPEIVATLKSCLDPNATDNPCPPVAEGDKATAVRTPSASLSVDAAVRASRLSRP